MTARAPAAPRPPRPRGRDRLTDSAGPPAGVSRARRPLAPAWRRVRPVLFWAHLATGVAAGAVVLVMSLTGVLLAYQRQLTEWSARSRSAAPAVAAPAPRPLGATPLPLDTLLARAAARVPAGGRASSLTVRADPAAPVAVVVGTRHTVYVDPYSGAVTEASPWLRELFVDAERWHRSLATGESLRDAVGATVTGACNLAFLFLVLSGLALWWPRQWSWRAFRAVLLVERGARGRRRDWNWHHVLGVWSAPALVAVVLSGVFISYAWPQRVVEWVAGVPAAPDAPAPNADAPRPPAAPRAGLATLLAGATGRVPGWQSVQLRLPAPDAADDGRATLTVSESRATMRPDRRTQLTLDAATGEVLESQRYADYDGARKFRSWMRYTHTGEVAGVVGQTVAMLASAAAVVLVWTGLALSWRRLRRAVGGPGA